MAAPAETVQKMSPAERGRVAHGLIQGLDSRLEATPKYVNSKVSVGRPEARKYVEKDRGTFTQGTTTYEVFSKNRVAWEIPVPLMSGIPMPLRSPIITREVIIRDEADPKKPKVTRIKLRTRFKTKNYDDPKGEVEKYKGGTVYVRDGQGKHKNSEEATRRAAEVVEGIDLRLFSN